ncbi:hypothetical protein R6Q57_009091 [Mikania cordata]
MSQLRFIPDHNIVAFIGDPPAKHAMFQTMVHGLNLSPINYAIREDPRICSSFINDFWNSVKEEKDLKGNKCLIGKVQDESIIISEEIIRQTLQFGDKATHPIEIDRQTIESALVRMGYEGSFPPTEKKLLHPYWRYLAHVLTQCLSGRKGGYDILNLSMTSCMVALTLGLEFNFSKMIYNELYDNFMGRKKEKFLAFPRFIQIIINKRHKNLIPPVGMLVQKKMPYDIFSYMVMNKKGKKMFVGDRPLEKFGRLFVDSDHEDELQENLNAFIVEEHDQAPSVPAEDLEFVNVEESSEEEHEVVLVNAYEHDLLRKRKAAASAELTKYKDKDDDDNPFVESIPKKKVNVMSRKFEAPIIKRQQPTQSFTSPTKLQSQPPSPIKPQSPAHSPSPIHFSQPQSSPISKGDKGKAPMRSSSDFIPEYQPIDIDLLQTRVFELEQDSFKKDSEIMSFKNDSRNLRMALQIKEGEISQLQKNVTFLFKELQDLLQTRVFELEQDSVKKGLEIMSFNNDSRNLRMALQIRDGQISQLQKNVTNLFKELQDLKKFRKDDNDK